MKDEKKPAVTDSPIDELVRTPAGDGLITAINGKKLAVPIPFKNGDRINVYIDHPKDGNRVVRFNDVEWVEF
jgi:hypothetical protein